MFNDSITEAYRAIILELWAQTADRLPAEEELTRRARAWRSLLGDNFFKQQMPYVLTCVCKTRTWRGPVHADEVLRVAEKVYGRPVSQWGEMDDNPGSPQVYSYIDNDWIPLQQAVDRIWHSHWEYDPLLLEKPAREAFEAHKEEILSLIYGDTQ